MRMFTMVSLPWLLMATATLVVDTRVVQALDDAEFVFEHQAREVFSGQANHTHPCTRPCLQGAPPMVCNYYFLLEHFTTMARACQNCPTNVADCFLQQCVPGDGRIRGVLTVNRMVPGPLIDVCVGDTVTVMVDNRMELGEGTAIHWHGLKQQGSPHMDGTNLITQCPINSQDTMTYSFKVQDSGTNMWHSHSSFQRADGLFGGFIVRTPSAMDPHRHLYDYDQKEYYIALIDWSNRTVGETFSQDMEGNIRADPTSLLVNGLASAVDGPAMPHPVFQVEAGMRYRFRIFYNGIMNCPVFVTVDEHTLTMIATDGRNFEPVEVDAFTIFSGERYDFVLKANHEVRGNFWMRFKAHGRCKNGVFQTAILRYEGASETIPSAIATYDNTDESPDLQRIFNGEDDGSSSKSVRVVNLLAIEPEEDEEVLTKKADKQFYISIAASNFESDRFKPPVQPNSSTVEPQVVRPVNHQFNYISSRLPPSPPLSQFSDIPQQYFCNNDTVDVDCSQTLCSCIHLLRVNLGDIVEFVLVSFTDTLVHPLHLHGHSFRVVSMANINHDLTVDAVKIMDKKGLIPRRTSHAPYKDTISVHAQSVVIIRFRANNPGFWFFHCHVEFHVELGMSMILQTGNQNQIPKPPKKFPTCGSWKPESSSRLIAMPERAVLATSAGEANIVAAAVGAAVVIVLVVLVLFFVLRRRLRERRTSLYQRVFSDKNEKYQSTM